MLPPSEAEVLDEENRPSGVGLKKGSPEKPPFFCMFSGAFLLLPNLGDCFSTFWVFICPFTYQTGGYLGIWHF